MRRRKCKPPPWVLEPDPNVLAHSVMDEAIERMGSDAPPDTPFEAEHRRETADLLAQACELEGIPVVQAA